MSDFYKKFLLEDVRRTGAASGRQIFLGAFGKHPGWDDHVEDLGLESDSLIFAKTLLYVEGIGSQIDKGDWEKLDAQQQIPAFKHLFIWQRAGQFLAGRLWSSSDGKGRTRYPMIVCVHCLGVPLTWVIDHVLPRLEKVEQECLLTKSAADVRFILTSARNSLRNALGNVGTEIIPTPPPVTRDALAQFIAHPDLGPQQEGWCRVLYQMQSQMGAFALGRFSLKGDLSGLRPQQLRVPPCAVSPAHTILLWTCFFQTQIDPAVPFLLTLPIEQPWLDVTLGEPGSPELFCLRASPKAVPLVSEVPYNLDADFRQKAAAILTNFQNGQGPPKDSVAPTQKTPLSTVGSSTRKKLLKWFGGGTGLLLALALLAVFLSRPKKDNAQAAKSEQQPNAAHVTGPPVIPQSAPVEAQSVDKDKARLMAEAEALEKTRLASEAEARRLSQEKQAATEKAKADAATRASEEREKLRLTAEAEMKRVAVEKAKVELAAQETARLKAQGEAREKALLLANAQPATPAVAPSASPTNLSRQMTNTIGMVFVQISPNYWVGKFEVTQADYEKVMGANPSKSKSKSDPQLPVESVTWNEAIKFCHDLTAREGAAGKLPPKSVYILPREQQWNEFLGEAKFEEGVTSDNTRRDSPAPVGSTAVPNKLGLFDVFGNVWEWSLDEGDAHQKLLLGGAYNSLKSYALKRQLAPDKQSANLGFRCVLVSQ